MKVLNLFENKEEKDEVIIFDEVLEVEGIWIKALVNNSADWNKTLKLWTYSRFNSDWDYFYCQDRDGIEAIYRKKKEKK
jgi:hypothetical protein